jgi:hypothetical protein
MLKRTMQGALAGLAGTTALNAATYLDMTWRGRAASDTQERAVAELARQAGQPIPGAGEERDNRLQALGALAGIGVGLGVGSVCGQLGFLLRKAGPVAGPVIIGACAMAVTNASLRRLGVSDPATWDAAAWLSDAIPHLAFGIATWEALRLFRD